MSELAVALDLTPAISGRTGVSRYARELARLLPAQGVDVRGFTIGRGSGSRIAGARHWNVPMRITEPLWRAVHLPRAEWLAGGGTVAHSLDLTVAPSRLPTVATVCDLAALDRPDLHPTTQHEHLRRRLAALSGVDLVIAISQATADALVRHGVERDRIVVTPLGVVPLPEPPPGDAAASAPYVLAVGQLTARKDYPTMLRAFAATPARDLRLIIVGPPGWRGEEIPALVERLGLADRVELRGWTSDAELAALYRDATAYCFTSVIEGFGLPLVEAMSAGVPIVASDIDVAHEVAGAAALYAPVGDAEAFGAALGEVATNPDVQGQLRAAALERCRQFTWERTATLTARAYRRLVACA